MKQGKMRGATTIMAKKFKEKENSAIHKRKMDVASTSEETITSVSGAALP